ncbi:MAG: thiamine-phosphate kinase [Candidatus Eremiobacteraeota bacterium]|nr:thiamine-phosphate kinase [Candidatus Eremiobacteraeota bacterium]
MRRLSDREASSSLTEDELVARIAEALAAPPRALRVGIGDDAAAWKTHPHHLSLLTTDMLVDGVHFRRAQTTPQALGRKALAENLSDIAAMGGTPAVAVVALGLTADVDDDWIRGFYRGMAALANSASCAIAGGDIVRAPALTIALTVAGEVRASRMRTRANAKANDVAAITAPLGRAAAGLALIDAAKPLHLDPAIAASLQQAYFEPRARLREGRYFGSRRAVHALMDLSDGLSTDGARMARASHLDLVLDAGALTPGDDVVAVAQQRELDAVDLVLNGGDDYELLAAIDARAYKHVADGYRKRFGRPLIAIGRFVSGDGSVWIERSGKREAVTSSGYDHLRRLR